MYFYPKFLRYLLDGQINLMEDQLFCALIDAEELNLEHITYRDIQPFEIKCNGYNIGGVPVIDRNILYKEQSVIWVGRKIWPEINNAPDRMVVYRKHADPEQCFLLMFGKSWEIVKVSISGNL